MTIGLQITDGTTTIDLNDGSYFEITELDCGYGDISALTVGGSVKLFINGTKAQIQAELAALQKILQQAIEYQGTGAGAALYSSLDEIVYLQYRTDGTETYYRSPIIQASLSFDPDAMLTLNFDCGGIEIIIDFERRNWWEGAEAQVPLATTAASRTTNAVTLYNPWNVGAGTYQHYVHIDHADVSGDLPSATRLEITNSYNDVNGLRYIWIGQNFTRADDFITILEAESATGTTPTVSATQSNGNYVRCTVPSGTETDLLSWPLTTNDITFAAGRWYKAIVRFTIDANVTSHKFRVQLKYNNVRIWRGPLVAPSMGGNTHDILTFQIPPSLAGMTSLAALSLVLSGYQTSGVNLTLDIDFLMLLPVDGYRMLDNSGAAGELEYNRRVVDDGITPALYEDDGSGVGKVPSFVGYSMPIMLQPERNQRIYFLNQETFGSAAWSRHTLSVKLYYRPRRLTI